MVNMGFGVSSFLALPQCLAPGRDKTMTSCSCQYITIMHVRNPARDKKALLPALLNKCAWTEYTFSGGPWVTGRPGGPWAPACTSY